MRKSRFLKMKKLIITAILLALGCLLLTACDGFFGIGHEHDYGEWNVVTEPTLKESGKLQRVCKGNEKHTESFALPALNDEDYTLEYDEKPTCEEKGSGSFTYEKDGQSFVFEKELPKSDHDYSEGLHCSMCEERAEDCIEIHTIEDLQRIAIEPNGKYILMNDLSLTGISWTGIGTPESPFCGKFDGNGYTISNISCPKLKYFGLFAYNAGDIYNLTVSGFSYASNFGDWEGNCGGAIAGYNLGNIVNCEVTGNVTIQWTQTLTYNEADARCADVTQTNTAFAGAVAGYNDGNIKGCTVNAVLKFVLSPRLIVHMPTGIMYDYATFNLYTTGSFGAFAGYNAGTVTSSEASSVCNVRSESYAESTTYSMHLGDPHHLILHTTINVGGAVGINAGSIDKCSAKHPQGGMTFSSPQNVCSGNIVSNTVETKLVGLDENGSVTNSVALQ